MKEDLNKWKDIQCSRVGRLHIVKTAKLPKLIYRFSAIPIKISAAFIVDIDKLIIKFI